MYFKQRKLDVIYCMLQYAGLFFLILPRLLCHSLSFKKVRSVVRKVFFFHANKFIIWFRATGSLEMGNS